MYYGALPLVDQAEPSALSSLHIMASHAQLTCTEVLGNHRSTAWVLKQELNCFTKVIARVPVGALQVLHGTRERRVELGLTGHGVFDASRL